MDSTHHSPHTQDSRAEILHAIRTTQYAAQQQPLPWKKMLAITASVALIVGFGTGTAVTNLLVAAAKSSSSQSMTIPMGGANTMTYDYTGSYAASLTANGSTQTADSKSLSATSADHNVALAQNGGTLTLTNAKLSKSGDSSNADNNNFYGTNSILLA